MIWAHLLVGGTVRGRNDEAWFNAVYQRYWPRVRGLIARTVDDDSVIDDLTQDTFLRVYLARADFDPTREVWPWLATIAAHVCADWKKRHETWWVALAKLTPPTVTSPSAHDEYLTLEKARLIEEVLSSLSGRHAYLLRRRHVEGRMPAQIAQDESTTSGTIRTELSRAARAYRARFKDVAERRGLTAIAPIPLFRRALRASPGIPPSATSLSHARIPLVAGITALAVILSGTSTNRTEPRKPPNSSAPRPNHALALPTPNPSISQQAGPRQPTDKGGLRTRLPLPPLIPAPGRPGSDIDDPEDMRITAAIFSPDFAHDRTAYAAGSLCDVTLCRAILFRSQDALRSWHRLSEPVTTTGEIFEILLPPQDGEPQRIFLASRIKVSDRTPVLYSSRDGGRTFTTVTTTINAPTIGGSWAISPDFTRGDPYIFLGSGWSYRDRAATFVPSFDFPFPPSPILAFAPDNGRLALLARSSQVDPGRVVRCDRGSQAWTCTPGARTTAVLPQLRLTHDFSRSGFAYAFAGNELTVTSDGGHTFRPLAPLPDSAGFFNLAIDARGQTLVAYIQILEPLSRRVMRSTDAGRSWTQVASPPPDYIELLTGTTDRFLALARAQLFCSADQGMTWHRRCA